jgi:choline-sulfatase
MRKGPQQQPNVVVIMADQWAAHAMSCAGSSTVHTPNLDRLAASGTRFERAYTTFPLCVPARSSLITGHFPHELGIKGNTAAPATRPGTRPDSLGHWFSAAGYDCAYAGKWHAPAASAEAQDGFEVVHPFGDKGLTRSVVSWLESRTDTDVPFLLFVSFDNPHTICEYARGQHLPYGDVQAPATVRDAPPLPLNFANAPFSPQALAFEKVQAEAAYGTAEYTADDWRLYRHAYAQLIERTDKEIGVVTEALDRFGLAANSVIAFTSDHGDGDAAHGWNQKTSLQEESIRVPLLLSGPGIRNAHVSNQMVSVGLDLHPTLCGAAGIPAPTGAKGINCLTEKRMPAEGVAVETAFGTSQRPTTTGRSIVTSQYKYTIYSWGKYREQLVDLIADPGELRNLAEESAFDEVLEEFRERLLTWCTETSDEDFLKRLVLPRSVSGLVRDEIYAVPY